MRTLCLNGFWQFCFHEGEALEDANRDPLNSPDIMCVPGAFDMMPDYYCKRGTAVYRRHVQLKQDCHNAYLIIAGMGLRCAVEVDGRSLGTSALPYSQLQFPTGPLTAGNHTVTIAVDNRFDDEKVKLFKPYYDFYAFGGFWHGIELQLQEKPVELYRLNVRTLDYRTGEVELEFLFRGTPPQETVAELSFDDETPRSFQLHGSRLRLNVPNFRLWSPEHPNLHHVTATIGGCSVTERFGIRTIEAKNKQLLLNGAPLYLKGFNRHESHPECGAATPETLMLEDLQLMRSMHCNFVRGCHYPQSQRFLDLCDEFGMLVWEESLGWGNTPEQMADPEYISLQIEQTQLMVRNSFNHPSVIIFAFQNENASNSPEGRSLNEALIRTIKAEDSGRLVTFACCRVLDDISNYETDLIAYNTYPYWIDNDAPNDHIQDMVIANRNTILKRMRDTYGDEKPIIVSEMGCCGIYGQHDRANAQWTEEFQAEYTEAIIKAVFDSKEICGLTIWQFADAKSYLRWGSCIRTKPLAQNLAGVVDGYRREKLAASVVRRLFAEKDTARD